MKSIIFVRMKELALAAVFVLLLILSDSFALAVDITVVPFTASASASGDTASVVISTSAAMEYGALEVRIFNQLPDGIAFKAIELGKDYDAFQVADSPIINDKTGYFGIDSYDMDAAEESNARVDTGKELIVYTFDISAASDGNHRVSFILNATDYEGQPYSWNNGIISAVIAKHTQQPNDGTGSPSAAQFKDVDPIIWYYASVDYVVKNGLMNGISDDLFDPMGITTRAMIVTILYRLEGQPVIETANPFGDVANGKWYTNAVIWANKNGLVNGYGDGRFGPTDSITREQFAAILYRYSGYKGYRLGAAADLSGYSDAESVSAWALESIKWANAEGLITGTTSTTLSPGNKAIRAEAATILMRFIENNR